MVKGDISTTILGGSGLTGSPHSTELLCVCSSIAKKKHLPGKPYKCIR